MASELKVNKITPESGLTLTLGDSGDTINFGSGVLPNFENLTVTGDLTVDTNSLKVDSTNNFVGIGTASPTVALDVVGAITATGNITGTLATAAQPNITSLGTLTGLTTAGNINLGDNYKINLGASNDLQIYHDGSHSIIADAGTGNLEFRGTHLVARNGGDTGNYFQAIDGAQVELYYNGSSKMSTTSTGIDVTGTVVSDGLTVDGGGSFTQAGGGLKVFNNGTAGYNANIFFGISDQTDGWSIGQGITANDGVFRVYDNGAGRARMAVTTDGDISFYEDTGTTAKLFWDASAESLGVGTSSPSVRLHVKKLDEALRLQSDTVDSALYQTLYNSAGTRRMYQGYAGASTSNYTLNNEENGAIILATNNAEKMRIDSSGNVGIGTSSPSQKLSVNGSISASNYFLDVPAGTYGILSDTSIEMFGSASSQIMVFKVNGNTERMRIDSSGNVGIGTSSPSSPLHIKTTGGVNAQLNLEASSFTPVIRMYSGGASIVPSINYGTGSGNPSFRFQQITTGAGIDGATTERMRIDSSGRLLVGTTVITPASTNVNGFVVSDSQIGASRSGTVAEINRISTDGTIVNFRKDGTSVGSIGTVSGDLFAGTNDTGMRFLDGSNAYIPYNPSTNSTRDNAIDLGIAAGRFKDLYLGGNIYLGGTGSANALDDYEEGTFTPLVEGTTTSGSATYTTQVAKYTKVGNIVHFSIFIVWTGGTGSGNLIITGLPFTSVGSSYHSAVTIGWISTLDYTNGKIPTAYVASSASSVTLEEHTDNGSSTLIAYDSQAGLILSGSYETT